MLIFRSLYEAWLRDATEAPLAPWQRHLLARALQKDEALRCYAVELVELNHEESVPHDLKAPDLRVRLHAALHAEEAPRSAWQPSWAWAGAAVLMAAAGASFWLSGPSQGPVEVAAVEQPTEAAALRIPSATPSATPTPTAPPSPLPSLSPTPTVTSTPAP